MFGISLLRKNNIPSLCPLGKTGSITLLTSAAIFHSDTCVIQLAGPALLACFLSCLLMLTLHSGNFQWAGGLSTGGFQLRSRLIGQIQKRARAVPQSVFFVPY